MSGLTQPQPNHPLTAIRRVGVVQDIANIPNSVNVYLGGDGNTLTPCAYLASYNPAAGDTVLILQNNADYIVVGAINGLPTVVNSYTPNWTNLTVGNGTVIANYQVAGKYLFLTVGLIFGTTTAISGNVALSIPSAYTSARDQDIMFRLLANPSAAQWLGLGAIASAGTTMTLWLPQAIADTRLAPLGSFGITMNSTSFVRVNGAIQIV